MREILETNLGIKCISSISINNSIIEQIVLQKEPLGELKIRRLTAEDAQALFDFFFHGLSDQSRIYFGSPYPLFTQPLTSTKELSTRITEWKKEDNWTVLQLIKDKDLIGICLLKRYNTNRPVTGIAIREDFQRMRLGTLLQTIIDEQARILNVKRLWSGAAQDNTASLQLHERCGFKRTGQLVPHFTLENGVKRIDRYDVDMIKELE